MKHAHKDPHSLFIHIVFILITAAVVVTIAFFAFARLTGKDHKHDFMRHVDAYTQSLARQLGSPPSQKRAVEMAQNLKIDIGLIGLLGEWKWKTTPGLPQAAELKKESHMHHREMGIGFYERWAFRMIPVQEGTLVFFLEAPGRWARGITPLLVFIFLVFLLTWGFIRHLLKPLRALETAVEQVGHGRFETRLQPTRPREFYKVAAGFNSMVRKIATMIREKEQILRDVSHELRTPLARLKLSLALLPESKERGAMEEDIRELETLVAEILEAAKIDVEEQGGSLELESLNLVEVILRAAESVSLIYPQVPLILHFGEVVLKWKGGIISGEQSADQVWRLQGNSEHFLRLFRNLMENGAKHTPEGAAVEVFGGQEKGKTVFVIQDEGPGIPEEYCEKIFEPFFQVDRKPSQAGYGLGLYLCRKIAHRYGGTITAENRTPRGTLFRVSFPSEEAVASPKEPLVLKNKRKDRPGS